MKKPIEITIELNSDHDGGPVAYVRYAAPNPALRPVRTERLGESVFVDKQDQALSGVWTLIGIELLDLQPQTIADAKAFAESKAHGFPDGIAATALVMA